MDIVQAISKEFIRNDLSDYKVGDTVKVHFLIREGKKERVQVFQGVVIQKRGTGISKTFTVRKISNGVAVERIFPRNSPSIAKIEVVRFGHVRRAKLFYLRRVKGKAARIKEKKRY